MGGAERVAISLSNFLALNDVDTFLMSFDNQNPSYPINERVNFINNIEKIVDNRKKGFKQRITFLKNNLRCIQPDIIFTMSYKVTFYALFYKYFCNRKVKIISSERCNPNSCDRKGLSKLLNSISSNLCDGFIFQTERARLIYSNRLQKKGVVIHNPVSNPLVFDVEKENIRSNKTITSMGRLEFQKGQDIMIKAFNKIATKFPEYKLIIFGEGGKRSELEKLIQDLGLQNKVILPGSNNEAIKEVAKSQIFLLTSRFEGMPNALLEAMAIGIPSISTDCEMGPSELIIDNKNGFLVPVDDIDALADKMELLLSDEKLRNRISIECQKIIETHSIDYIFGEYLSYFSKFTCKKKTFLEKIVKRLSRNGFLNFLPDKMYLSILYYAVMGKSINWNNPQTFNEKLQWLKLYDRNSLYTMMVDKYAVRKYISQTIGEKYLIPLLGMYEKFEDISFKDLPSKFVMKCNHDSGGLVICKNKENFDIENARIKIDKCLSQNYYYSCREWPYKNVKPKIIIEEYMEDSTKEGLIDYKVMCFNGKAKMIFTCNERFSTTGLKVTFFDLNWNKLPFERHYPSSKKEIKKPYSLKEMIKLSEKLAKGLPFVRVDWYEVDNRLYFGELTFYPGSGMEEFSPYDWDIKIGEMLKLPSKGTKDEKKNNY